MTKRTPIWLSQEEIVEVLAWAAITEAVSRNNAGQTIDYNVEQTLRDAWESLEEIDG